MIEICPAHAGPLFWEPRLGAPHRAKLAGRQNKMPEVSRMQNCARTICAGHGVIRVPSATLCSLSMLLAQRPSLLYIAPPSGRRVKFGVPGQGL
jgi:hypothetical protein